MGGVGLFTLLIGSVTAWLITMYRFPGRKVLQWALVLPLAIPTYIIAYTFVHVFEYAGPVQGTLRQLFGWSSPADYWFPELRSLPGAILVLSLVLYPYVYLTARASFIKQGAAQIEVARTLGCESSAGSAQDRTAPGAPSDRGRRLARNDGMPERYRRRGVLRSENAIGWNLCDMAGKGQPARSRAARRGDAAVRHGPDRAGAVGAKNGARRHAREQRGSTNWRAASRHQGIYGHGRLQSCQQPWASYFPPACCSPLPWSAAG